MDNHDDQTTSPPRSAVPAGQRWKFAAAAMVTVFVVTVLVGYVELGGSLDLRQRFAVGQLRSLARQLGTFQHEHGSFPADLGLLPSIPSTSPVRDPWGYPLTYHTDGTTYMLRSFGRDGRRGGHGLDGDLVAHPDQFIVVPQISFAQFMLDAGFGVVKGAAIAAAFAAFATWFITRFSLRNYHVTVAYCVIIVLGSLCVCGVLMGFHIPSGH